MDLLIQYVYIAKMTNFVIKSNLMVYNRYFIQRSEKVLHYLSIPLEHNLVNKYDDVYRVYYYTICMYINIFIINIIVSNPILPFQSF